MGEDEAANYGAGAIRRAREDRQVSFAPLSCTYVLVRLVVGGLISILCAVAVLPVLIYRCYLFDAKRVVIVRIKGRLRGSSWVRRAGLETVVEESKSSLRGREIAASRPS